MSNRTQFVQMNNNKSDLLPVRCGVPQGSVLGPLLFLLDINDISKASNICKYILFADDSNIYLHHKNLNVLINTANQELIPVKHWIAANKLTLNLNKTHYIIFSRHSKKSQDRLPLVLGDHILTQQEETKFLGVTINKHLHWKSHIRNILSKINKQCGILFHV